MRWDELCPLPSAATQSRKPSRPNPKNALQVFDFLGLPPHTIIDTEAKNTRRYPPISPQIKEKLARFYAPFNRQLFDLLGREMPRWAGAPPPGGEPVLGESE